MIEEQLGIEISHEAKLEPWNRESPIAENHFDTGECEQIDRNWSLISIWRPFSVKYHEMNWECS